MLRACTYMRLSSEEQNNGVAVERMLFLAKEAARLLNADLPDDRVYLDLISGRKDDRPDFKEVWGLIEHNATDIVIFNRIDRLGRDAELLLRLWKLFEKSKVRAYICDRRREIDFKDLEDWRYWTTASMKSEEESRVISSRATAAHSYNRHKGHSAYRCPMGYMRDPESRKYRLRPEQKELCDRAIAIFIEEDYRYQRAVSRLYDETGTQMTPAGFKSWIHNPVLRGHTPRWSEHKIEYNTHPDDVLLSEVQYKLMLPKIEIHKRVRGRNVDHPAPLSGLMRCTCGSMCSMLRVRNKNERVKCSAFNARPGAYKHIGAQSIHYELIERQVIEAIARLADQLAETATLEIHEVEAPVSPEILQKEAQIEYLKEGIARFGDLTGEQSAKITQLKTEIAQLMTQPPEQVQSEELKALLSQLNDINIWAGMDKSALRDIFVALLREVSIDFNAATAVPEFSPHLSFRPIT